MKKNLLILFFLSQILTITHAQTTERPMIWVKPSDKTAILDKIAKNQWAKDFYEAFKNRVAEDVKNHQADPKAYLSKMPLDWSKKKDGQVPPFVVFKDPGSSTEQRQAVMHYLQTGIDCGIIYFLTGEEKYAQLGADVLNTIVEALVQNTPNTDKGGSFMYEDEHLREAREIGAQIPILYDFIQPFIAKGGLSYNVATDKRGAFSTENAEKIFKGYIKLALEVGIIDCNWPVLEASSLVGNSLALSNENERKESLEYYLTKNTPHQDALLKVVNFYTKNGGIWPESLGYSNEVGRLSTYLMTLLTRMDGKLDLGNKYPQIPMALSMSYYLTYPNQHETVLFGDGHRAYHPDYDSYEMAYLLGKISNNPKLIQEFGALLNTAVNSKSYDRAILGKRGYGAAVYREPTHLLWDVPAVEGQVKEYPLPTTDRLPFAGITIQRNLSTTGNDKDGLMGFVGGGTHVHGHATGMSMELYGKGYVLGMKAGRGSYTTDLHENYFRLFAANNTVVVNGASETDGKWVNLGQNTVELVAVEPALKDKAVSPNYSFSTSSFIDDKGDLAEATQERTLGIIRTSPTTGYYLDIFRSKSYLPNQYHDYIYRNLGESLDIQSDNKNISFKNDENRFSASADKEWVKNRKFKHPGWHFFKNVETSEVISGNVSAIFTAEKLEETPVKMNLFITGNDNREYTKAISPVSTEAPKPYSGKTLPTLVIRQKGDAWAKPFAVVYEPFEGTENTGSVQSVEDIIQNNQFKGLKIMSKIEGKNMTQYAFILDSNESIFEDKKSGISFKGRYGILTLDEKGKLQSIYVGEGQSFAFNKIKINSKNGKPVAFFIDFSKDKPVVNGSDNVDVQF